MATTAGKDFGEELRRRRLAAGLSQEALAERAGLSARGVSDLERGLSARPHLETVRLLADALGLAEPARAALVAAARPGAAAAAPPAGLPAGTVAFLAADVEGSTRLWEADPAAAKAALGRALGRLREAVAAHGGAVHKEVGDALHAAFPTAPAAVAAALAAQRALRAEPGPTAAPVRVRLAIHAATAHPDPDGEYRSPALNRLARLLSAGHGGQTLLSQAAAELARDHLPEGSSLRDLGEQRLRDLFRPERAWQLLAPGLPDGFPPLATLAARPNNLPAQPTPLVGREREVAQVVALLGRDEVRLLTLTGPGGVGKTRLALQAAADLLDRFPDGCWFVDLAPLSDPALVPAAIAGALGVREEGGRPLVEALTDRLRHSSLLLVPDNFEHLLAAAPVVAGLLREAPSLTVLATSRAPLRLRGEREYPVPPLAVPDPKRLPALERLTQYAAVRLFVERAVAAKPDFAVTNANAPAVAEICGRLDGLPLAIELAAARVKLFPPGALLQRLSSRLTVLTGGARDLPARQRTLRDAIAWSHDLLDDIERSLFRRLAVFAGGCTVEAAEAVANPDGDLDVFGELAVLVDHSLLRQGEGGDGGPAAGTPRFAMLETIREYALERLADSGEAGEVHDRHAGWCLALAETAEPELLGAGQGTWLARLEAEHDNLRASLGWAVDHDAEVAARLAGAVWRFWHTRGHPTEGRSWLARVLAAGAAVSPAARAAALHGDGTLAQAQGDHARAAAALEESVVLRRRLGDLPGLARALNSLGIAVASLGDHARASALLEEARRLSRELRDEETLRLVLPNLGRLAEDRGDDTGAAALYAEALSLARAAGDRRTTGSVLLNLGALALHRGDLDAAGDLLEEALALFRELGDRRQEALVLHDLGEVALHRGSDGWGAGPMREALALFRELGDKAAAAVALSSLGIAAQRRGDRAEAAALHAEGLALAREVDDQEQVSYALAGLAGLAVANGQAGLGARLLGAAEALREALGTVVPPIYGCQDERVAAAARAALGEDAFARDRDQGRMLPPGAALAEALAAANLAPACASEGLPRHSAAS